jgi:putative ABC transport system substrate-binding protein
MPVIGFLNSASPETFAPYVAAFHSGLREAGYTEGQNVAIEYRWAGGNYELLSRLAADLVARRVSMIVATGGAPSALAARAATSTVPTVFMTSGNLVQLGLVKNLSRPGGNATGVSLLTQDLEPKRLEILSELAPRARIIAVLLNPNNVNAEHSAGALQEAARGRGQQLLILHVGAENRFASAFDALRDAGAEALVVASDPYFNSRRERLVELARQYRVPAIYEWREFVQAGGLISYGPSLTKAYRQCGIYAGQILAGANPAELPVHQPREFEIVLNVRTAKELGLDIPSSFLVRADEVIE